MTKINKEPTDVDKHVGLQIRKFRRALGMTQEQLGQNMNITFQQVQKYERGVNRVSAGRAYAAAQILGVSVMDLFPPEEGDRTGPETVPRVLVERALVRVRDAERQLADVLDMKDKPVTDDRFEDI